MTTRIDIRLPEQELEILKAYCEQEDRTQTEVIREFIRSLKKKIKKKIDN
ncbi:MAG: ribbon-helix-helix protein, CopG family [Xenococcaceae cyanobacterium]